MKQGHSLNKENKNCETSCVRFQEAVDENISFIKSLNKQWKLYLVMLPLRKLDEGQVDTNCPTVDFL